MSRLDLEIDERLEIDDRFFKIDHDYALSIVNQALPCPFCGCGTPHLVNTHSPSYWIECPDCGAEMHAGGAKTHHKAMAKALEAWNTRVASPQ